MPPPLPGPTPGTHSPGGPGTVFAGVHPTAYDQSPSWWSPEGPTTDWYFFSHVLLPPVHVLDPERLKIIVWAGGLLRRRVDMAARYVFQDSCTNLRGLRDTLTWL